MCEVRVVSVVFKEIERSNLCMSVRESVCVCALYVCVCEIEREGV